MLFLCYSFTFLGQSDVVGAASFTCSTLADFDKVICGTHELLLRVGSGWLNSKIHVLSTSPEVFDKMPIISAKLSVRVTGADKARKVDASSISEIGPRGIWAAQLLRKRAPLRLIRRTMPLRFLRKQSCWGSGSRDSGSSVSSIFEKVIMLGVWLSRFGGRYLFDFGASNLVGSVFSNVSKCWAFLPVCLATEHGG